MCVRVCVSVCVFPGFSSCIQAIRFQSNELSELLSTSQYYSPPLSVPCTENSKDSKEVYEPDMFVHNDAVPCVLPVCEMNTREH